MITRTRSKPTPPMLEWLEQVLAVAPVPVPDAVAAPAEEPVPDDASALEVVDQEQTAVSEAIDAEAVVKPEQDPVIVTAPDEAAAFRVQEQVQAQGKRRRRVQTQTDAWYHGGASVELVKILGKCAYEGYQAYQVFDDFLDAVVIGLDRLPSFWNQVVHEETVADPPEIASRWKRLADRYRPQALERFGEAFALLLRASADEADEPTYADVLGGAFMEFVCPSDAKYHGQFFTPWNVAVMMAEMTAQDLEQRVLARMEDALEHDRMYLMGRALGIDVNLNTKLMLLAGEETRPHYQPVTICDPACGSGIMLLACASVLPRWAVANRLVEFFGQDIDATCANMARINCRLYGLNGQLYEFREKSG